MGIGQWSKYSKKEWVWSEAEMVPSLQMAR